MRRRRFRGLLVAQELSRRSDHWRINIMRNDTANGIRKTALTLALAGGVLIAALLPAGSVLAQGDDIPAQIETSQTFGNFEVLYTVIPSTTLLPEMAAEYKIVRANDQALVNISVRKHLPDGTDIAQAATLKGTYSDLIQPRNLEFREVREHGAIYYLAQLRFSDRETLRFDLKVTPTLAEGETASVGTPYSVSFTRKFFVDK
jgi:hypothetical protein